MSHNQSKKNDHVTYEMLNLNPVVSIADQKKEFSALSVEDLIIQMKTNVETGLSTTEANHRKDLYGPNQLAEPPVESFFSKIKEQFEDLLVRLLLLAAIVSFAISQFETEEEQKEVPTWLEPLVIFIILILNATIGIYQDYSADNALDALKALQNEEALVLRDKFWTKIKSKHLVPGDIVKITQGDKAPADLRIIQILSTILTVDQSMLTGESEPATKEVDNNTLNLEDDAIKVNMVYSGTLITKGNALCVVVFTGMKTEIGIIQENFTGVDNQYDETPLKKKLDEFGDKLAKIIGLICIAVWFLNIKKFNDPALGGTLQGALYYFKVAISLAVAAIPEGLPAVITTCLALGTRRMAKENAIVRKLTSVETLGCTTVICTDKTGTLTTNQMIVKEMLLFGNNVDDIFITGITGTSYTPEGHAMDLRADQVTNKNIRLFCECMSLNNQSNLIKDFNTIRIAGLPTEAAMRVLVEKIGKLDKNRPNDKNVMAYNNYLSNNYNVLATLEFDNARKMMSVLCYDKLNKKNICFTKGAAEILLAKSTHVIIKSGESVLLTEEIREETHHRIQEFASKGLRTLAICYKEDCGELNYYDGPQHPSHKFLKDPNNYKNLESNLSLIGIVGLHDPPREEAKFAIAKCRKAGIAVIMITGDNKATAETIGKELGIITNDEIPRRSFTGHDFELMSPSKKENILNQVIKECGGLVISRSDPLTKKHIVQNLRNLNQVVAMTGDGVNDAPALKHADIGIAMGLSGTSVAKEASKMILSDDNFATIVKAVEEGRAIYCNMKGFIRYMISSNIGEVLSILFTTILGIPDGFNSIQLLWVNLVTDGLPAAALSFNPPSPDIMKKPPRKSDEPIVTKWIFIRYLIIGLYVGLATVGIFIYWYIFYTWSKDQHTLVTFSQLVDWSSCPNWKNFKVNNYANFDFSKNPCIYFTIGKQKASSLSLSVLVIIEMFNALNALTDDTSLIKTGLFLNPFLLFAILVSVGLHCLILYIPTFQQIFSVLPLSAQDWLLVLLFSLPVFIIDEILKYLTRRQRNIKKMKMHDQQKFFDV